MIRKSRGLNLNRVSLPVPYPVLHPIPEAVDILILTTYAGFAIILFKAFRVPVNGFTVTTAALGGIGLLSGLLLLMNYNHPYTKMARFYFHTTPIIPEVRGKVIEVLVTDSQHVKAGDVLFKIDPTPYENAVAQKKAELAGAKQRALELDTDLAAAEQAYQSALSDRDGAEDLYQRADKLAPGGVISPAEFEQQKQKFLSAEAKASQAKSQRDSARLASLSRIEGVNSDVANIEAQLATAQFDLDQTVVRAPTDGIVLQVLLRPGMMATPLPFKPVMVFEHDEPPYFVASFLQNSAQRLVVGSEAEVILPSAPGRFFKGSVSIVGASVAKGQLQPSGDLIDAEEIHGEGRINVVIKFNKGELDGYQIIPGSTGQAAIYSNHLSKVAVIRRVLLRMKSWMNFAFSDGH